MLIEPLRTRIRHSFQFSLRPDEVHSSGWKIVFNYNKCSVPEKNLPTTEYYNRMRNFHKIILEHLLNEGGPDSQEVPWFLCTHSDLSVFSNNRKDVTTNLLNLMKAAFKNDLIFNRKKCQFKHPQFTFYDIIISTEWIKHYPEKTRESWHYPEKLEESRRCSHQQMPNNYNPF